MTGLLAIHADVVQADLFGPGILWMTCPLANNLICLFPEERAVIEQAVPKRQREFATARLCARTLLTQLGFPETPLLPGPDRSPVWPAGAVGSISYCRTIAGAAVALDSQYASLGLDVEDREPIGTELLGLIASGDEREWVEHGRDEDAGLRAKLLFSAKESVYKCHYPVFGSALKFGDVKVEFDEGARSFQALILRTDGQGGGTTLNGRFWLGETIITTFTDLPGGRADGHRRDTP